MPPLVEGSVRAWEQLKKHRVEFQALIPVQGRLVLVDSHCFSDFAGMLVKGKETKQKMIETPPNKRKKKRLLI